MKAQKTAAQEKAAYEKAVSANLSALEVLELAVEVIADEIEERANRLLLAGYSADYVYGFVFGLEREIKRPVEKFASDMKFRIEKDGKELGKEGRK
jgi:EAL domain-containing protein (putative c-di-GMP-specific phosphodiesterase class I)